jgi:AN1-type zinc finger protein 5/6
MDKLPIKPRCAHCNIKLGVNYFECKCAKLHCAKHRLPFDHACTFDYNKENKGLLEKKNPRIIGEKLTKI